MTSERSETRTTVRALYVSVTLAAIASAATLESAHASKASLQQRIAGCWSQTSPYQRDQLPADKHEWGSRTWCFRPRGVLETWQTACGRSGECDGWDGRFQYRVRGAGVELQDPRYVGSKDDWRKCLPVFETGERFILTNCEISQEAFVRARDPNRIH